MRVSKRPYGVPGPLSTHTEVKPQAGTSLESIIRTLMIDQFHLEFFLQLRLDRAEFIYQGLNNGLG